MNVEFFADTDLLSRRVGELVSCAQDIEIAVAWAGKPEEGVQDLLWKMRTKVRKLVVGCSLYNTNPGFLAKWQGQPGFRVVLDATEVFHPKLYLFRVGREVHLLIGSSNLTGGGFERNREANVMLRGAEEGPIADAAAYIRERHQDATVPHGKVWNNWLATYRAAWTKRQNLAGGPQTRNVASPRYGARIQGVGEWSFPEYFKMLKAGYPSPGYELTLNRWLTFLEHVRERWSAAGWSLEELPRRDRRLIASTL